MGEIRIGVGGWTFEPWRGAFYPPGTPQKNELAYMSRQLTSIEINGTYYRTQTRASFEKWRYETPEGFVFAVKGPRYATNRQILAEAGPSIERFFESGVTALGDKLGPVNWQLMATKKFDPDDFAAFLALLPRRVEGYPIRHAVEVRHPSFATPDLVDLAREHEVAIVLAGDAKFPLIPDVTAPFVYARIMGTSAEHPEGYSPAALDGWVTRARAWAEGRPDGLETVSAAAAAPPRDVFLYVIAGHKEANPTAATALIRRLR